MNKLTTKPLLSLLFSEGQDPLVNFLFPSVSSLESIETLVPLVLPQFSDSCFVPDRESLQDWDFWTQQQNSEDFPCLAPPLASNPSNFLRNILCAVHSRRGIPIIFHQIRCTCLMQLVHSSNYLQMKALAKKKLLRVCHIMHCSPVRHHTNQGLWRESSHMQRSNKTAYLCPPQKTIASQFLVLISRFKIFPVYRVRLNPREN